ncbi:MAG TPA: M36 family metallopeptidase [Verrucomicrobiae bacterium]
MPRPHGAPFRVFDFPLDLAQPPTTYGDAAVVQLFYWCNFMHDKLYEIGFTEAAGNFQKDNFGRGGLGKDAIQADAQDGSGINNANFTPTADGTPGRVQMFTFTGPEPDRDGSLDAEIILHEYTHGLSTRLVGGGVGISAQQTAAMGEGWSDFYALTLLSEPSDDLDGTYVEGGYATLGFNGLMENYYFGIRHYPYTTDLSKNPLTFKDIDPSQIDPHSGVPMNPAFPFNPANAGEVHHAGEVWCVTLWEAKANLIRKHGFEAGRRLILQLVTDGMKLSPPNPDFLEARDAIIQADLVNNGGANYNELWAAFAKRGLGFSAVSPPASTTTGLVESFNLPDALLITPMVDAFFSGRASGPFTPSCRTYVLTNHTSLPLTWKAGVTRPWLTVSPAGGTLVPGAAVQVTLCLNGAANALPLGTFNDQLTFSNVTSRLAQVRDVQLQLVGFTSMPFHEDWESGAVRPFWTVTGTGPIHSLVTTNSGPHGGFYHLTMDSAGSSVVARNEVTLGIDLAGFTNVVLKFWAKTFGDEPDGPPASPFINGADFDGVAISEDGIVWYEVQGLRSIPSAYTEFTVNLDEALAAHGLSYNSTFRIRFNQIDDNPIPFDGISLDDISLTGVPAYRLKVAVPSQATEGDGVLAGQGAVLLAAPQSDALIVSLTSSDDARVKVPSTVSVPRGATNASFNVIILDDSLLNGTQVITISAQAAGFFSEGAAIAVRDNETAVLQVSVEPKAREGDGTIHKMGLVRTKSKPDRNITVNLISSDPDEVQVPPTVVIPARKNSARFDVTIVDDHRLDGKRRTTITARVDNWVDGSDTIEVSDNEDHRLALVLPASASEGDGTLTNAGLLRLSGTVPTNLVVALHSSDPARLTVPASVVVPAGGDSATFDLTIADNTRIDGRHTITVKASAHGFDSDSAVIDVLDDETPPMLYGPSPPHLSNNNSLDADLSWRAGLGEILINGGFETGDFTGWSQVNVFFGTFIINDGTFNPDSPDGPLPPFAGKYSALLQQIGSGQHVLYQDVTIPADAKSATLSWADRIRNHGPQFVHPNQEFRVEIRDPATDAVLATAYQTQPGDVLLADWKQRSFDVSPFRGRAIRIAFAEEDSLGYFNLHVDNVSVQLGGNGVTTFDVFFGTKAIPGAAEFLGTTTNASWTLPPLALATRYYWQIVSRRGAAQTRGPIWQFTTRGIGTVDHFEWSPLAATQTLNQPFLSKLTAMDDLGNIATSFTGPATLTGLIGPETSPSIVIAEIDTAANDVVEFANVAGREVNISGWQISLYDGRSWPAPRITFVVPTNTICHTDELFLLRSGTGTSLYPNFFAGAGVFWSNLTVSNQVAVLLRDAASNIVDFVCALDANPALITNPMRIPAQEWVGNPLPTNLNTTATYQRLGRADHNNGADWTIAANSVGQFNNELSFTFDSRAPIDLSPSSLSSFVAGVWTGNLTVHQPLAEMKIRADDGDGHLGVTGVFSVRTANDLVLTIADAPNLPIIGDDVTYTLTVANTGPATAAGVTLTDTLPPGVVFVSASSTQGGCGNAAGLVTCALGPLPGGADATVTIVVTTTAAGLLTNTASVTRQDADASLSNNTATAVTTVNFPHLFINDVAVTEGNTGSTNAVFTVSLSAPCKLPVSVQYASSNLNAVAGQDYEAISGTLIFAPGSITQALSVVVLNDTLAEAFVEAFVVNLFSPTNAFIIDGQGQCRILDNDPQPRLSIGDVTVVEGPYGSTTNAVFNVGLSAASRFIVTVRYATSAGTATGVGDYLPQSGVLTFAPETTNQSLTVVVKGDNLFESNETFFVTLSSPANALLARAQGTGTILDDDSLELDHFAWSQVPSPQFVHTPFAATITAQDGLNRTVTNFTGPVSISGVAHAQDITAGMGTNAWESPMGTLYHDERTQVIYLANEIGGPGRINALALFVDTIPGQTMTNWTIRMQHTTLASFAQPAWQASGWTTVYQNNETVLANGWVTFRFSTPFSYNGTDNLLIDFSFNNTTYSSDGLCRYFTTGQPRSIYFQTDSAFGDPLNWSGNSSPPPAPINRAPNLRLSIEDLAELTPVTSGPFVAGVWTGEIAVLQPATNVFLRASDGNGHLGLGNFFSVAPTTASDGGALPDAWKLNHFATLTSAGSGAADDPDRDGLTNLQEFLAGTDPLDARSVVRITSIQLDDANVRIRFTSVPGKRYRLERTSDLGGSFWRPVSESLAATGAAAEVTDQNAAGERCRIYRVRLVP